MQVNNTETPKVLWVIWQSGTLEHTKQGCVCVDCCLEFIQPALAIISSFAAHGIQDEGSPTLRFMPYGGIRLIICSRWVPVYTFQFNLFLDTLSGEAGKSFARYNYRPISKVDYLPMTFTFWTTIHPCHVKWSSVYLSSTCSFDLSVLAVCVPNGSYLFPLTSQRMYSKWKADSGTRACLESILSVIYLQYWYSVG